MSEIFAASEAVTPWTAENVPDACVIRYSGSECMITAKNLEGVVFISGDGAIHRMNYEQLAYCRHKVVKTTMRVESGTVYAASTLVTWELCRR